MAPRKKVNQSAEKFNPQDEPEDEGHPDSQHAAEEQPVDDSQGLLDTLIEREEQLRRLLKVEHNEWSGVCGRRDLRNVADNIRNTLAKDKNNEG